MPVGLFVMHPPQSAAASDCDQLMQRVGLREILQKPPWIRCVQPCPHRACVNFSASEQRHAHPVHRHSKPQQRTEHVRWSGKMETGSGDVKPSRNSKTPPMVMQPGGFVCRAILMVSYSTEECRDKESKFLKLNVQYKCCIKSHDNPEATLALHRPIPSTRKLVWCLQRNAHPIPDGWIW